MADSVILNEQELLAYKNQLVNYADFLCRKYSAFATILSKVQNDAFVDRMVCARLSELIEETKPIFQEIDSTCSSKVGIVLQKAVDEVALADDFTYPASVLDAIRSYLHEFF